MLRPERYPLFLTALRAGLRLGELLALQWQDIQFGDSEDDPNRFILVRHNFTRRQFTTTKNRRERRVDLSKELRRVLMDLRDQRTLEAMSSGSFDGPAQPRTSKLVFPSQTGGPLEGSNLYNRDFLPSLEAAGIRRITFDALRHTFASLLIQQGASLAYVKEQLGHSSIQVTVDTYGHLIPGGNIGGSTPVMPKQLRMNPHPRRNLTLRTSPQISRKLLRQLVGPPGFEPGTNGL